MRLSNLDVLYKKLDHLMFRKEWDAIIKCLPKFDITEIEMKRVEVEIKRWAISEEKMIQILWEIRNEIIEEDIKLFHFCFYLDLMVHEYSRETFMQFVHTLILRLISRRRYFEFTADAEIDKRRSLWKGES